MTDVSFHTGVLDAVPYACRLLRKAWRSGARVAVFGPAERLARMEVELDAARRALHERKLIERATGALRARLGLSEEAAFRALQKASMDHNRRLLDVAEATLSLPDMVAPAQRGAQPR